MTNSAQVKDVLISNGNEDKLKKEEIFGLIQNIEVEIKQTDRVVKSKEEENIFLKQRLDAKIDESSNVKKLKEEIEVLKQKEAEAADQVQKSIKVAEHIRQQKSESEFEVRDEYCTGSLTDSNFEFYISKVGRHNRFNF